MYLAHKQPAAMIRFLTHDRVEFVAPNQIIRLEAISNYTRIYFSNSKPILMAKVLHEYESLLRPYGFLRTHRSHLVNVDHIEKVGQDDTLQMKGAGQVMISRRKRSTVLARIGGDFVAA